MLALKRAPAAITININANAMRRSEVVGQTTPTRLVDAQTRVYTLANLLATLSKIQKKKHLLNKVIAKRIFV